MVSRGCDSFNIVTRARKKNQLAIRGAMSSYALEMSLVFSELCSKTATNMKDENCKGPIIRIGANELSFFDIDAYVGEVYTTNTKFSKTRYFYGRQSNTATNVFTELDRTAHSAEKRLISHAFSRKNLLGMQDMINANTQRWVEQLRSRAREGGWIALWDATRCLTLDTISTFSYGSPEGGLDQPDFKHEVFDVFNSIPIFAPAVQCLPLVPSLFKIIATLYPKFIDSRTNEVSLWRLCLTRPSVLLLLF